MQYSLAANLTRFLIYRRTYSRVVCMNRLTTEAVSNQAAHSTLLFNIPDACPGTSPTCALTQFSLQLTHKCCLHCLLCYSPCVHKQVPGCTVACCYLLLYLPAAANLYIVEFQDSGVTSMRPRLLTIYTVDSYIPLKTRL